MLTTSSLFSLLSPSIFYAMRSRINFQVLLCRFHSCRAYWAKRICGAPIVAICLLKDERDLKSDIPR